MKEPFVTGLPDRIPAREPQRSGSVDEALEKLRTSVGKRKRRKLQRIFSSPGTADTRRITQRIIGERDE